MRRWGCWSRPRPGRWTRCRPRRWSACAGRSPSTRVAAATRPGCCCARPGCLSRSTPPWPARRTWRRSAAAMCAGDLGRPGGVREAAEAARAAPPGPGPPRAVDVVLDAVALRLTEGHAAAAAALTRALELLVTLDAGADEARRWLWLAGGRAGGTSSRWSCGTSSPGMPWPPARFRSPVIWAPSSSCSSRSASSACIHLLAGELSAAERLIEEDRLIAEATGNPPTGYTAMMLAAWQGREQEASELIQATVQDRDRTRPGPAGRRGGVRERGAGQRPGPVRRRAGRRLAGLRARPSGARPPGRG